MSSPHHDYKSNQDVENDSTHPPLPDAPTEEKESVGASQVPIQPPTVIPPAPATAKDGGLRAWLQVLGCWLVFFNVWYASSHSCFCLLTLTMVSEGALPLPLACFRTITKWFYCQICRLQPFHGWAPLPLTSSSSLVSYQAHYLTWAITGLCCLVEPQHRRLAP